MPITMERILAVVNEFDAALHTHRTFLDNLQRLAASIEPINRDTAASIRAEIESIPYIVTDALRDEKKHFQRFGRENERKRRTMERKRRAAGVPERSSIQYRINAMERNKGLDDERAYREWMQGDAITSEVVERVIETLPPEQVATGEPILDAKVGAAGDAAPALPPDDTSSDPARWSPEKLAAEAARGTINMDDEI